MSQENQDNQLLDKHDHRRLGQELKLFHFSEHAPGMVFWLPNGARMRKRLEDILYKAHKSRGYEPVLTPKLMDVSLWKISGHYDNYKENMYFSEVEKRENALAPMNCPGHIINYKEDVRSYRDFPMRYFEFGGVYRDENSGSLHGLFRVRNFTQDDLHSFVRVDQVRDEIKEHMSFIKAMLDAFGFEYEINFSTKPAKAIGDAEVWEKAEAAIADALADLQQGYVLNEGDGAFYGPKIDIRVKDNHGRMWQLGTIQVDMNLPERFDMHYTGDDGKMHRPVMLHRAVMGSFERFMGILLEHYEGNLPVAISPHQVAIVPIAPQDPLHMEAALELKRRLNVELGADVILYADSNTFNKRIKMSEEDKNPIIAIIGNSEAENGTVNLRHKRKMERYEQSVDEFIEAVRAEMNLVI